DALLLFGFEAGFGRDFDFHRRRLVAYRRFFGRRGTDGGDVGVDAGAREHVAAAVGGGFAGRDRALAGADDRAGVAFGVGQGLEGQRGVAGVLDGDPVFHLLAQLGLHLCSTRRSSALDALLLFGFEAGFAFGFGFDFVGG